MILRPRRFTRTYTLFPYTTLFRSVSALNENLSERVELCLETFGFRLESIFPLVDKISSEIEKTPFLLSHFIQPDLFIRIHRSEEHTSELQSLMRISYDVFCLKTKTPVHCENHIENL